METKKIASFTKRIILGKHKPTPILRFLCWLSIIWDTAIGIYMTATGVLFMIRGNNFSENYFLEDFTQNFCFTYAALHGVSLLGTILMYRVKKSGFWLYSIGNIALAVSAFVFVESLEIDYLYVSFTLIMIGLFATQLKKMS
jgi:hypothetical protein